MPTRRFTNALALAASLAWQPGLAELQLQAPAASAALRDNLLLHLRLDDLPCDTPRWRVRRLFARLPADMEPALRALGYYRAEVSSQLDFDEDCWTAVVHLSPGPRVRIRAVDVDVTGDAAADPAFAAALRDLPLAPGEPLDHSVYEAVKTRLQELALERGYLDARLAHRELRVYPAESAADVHLRLDSGPRYRFGDVRLGPQPLDEGLLHRYVQLEPGAYFSSQALFDMNRALSDAGYFRSVQVLPRRDQTEALAVPVDVEFTPVARHAWRAGIGYETDTGARFRLGYENRYLNAAGHRFASELRLSQIESGLTANYLIPGRDPRREHLEIKAALLNENSDTVQSRSIQAGVRQTLLRGAWTETRFVEALYEDSVVGGDTPEAFLLMPGIGWKRTHSDNPLRTSRGYRLNLELRGAHENLLSTTSLVRLRAGAMGIYRFGEAGRLTGRLDLGTTWVDEFADVPASLRFFAGGDRSVRGYGYERLGPRDDSGDPTGGQHLLTGSLEYEHPIKGEDWWLGAFVDGGNVFNDTFEAKWGYGAGLRWFTPVGLLRLDFAIPSDTFEDEWRIHFAFGADL
ncbi:MAG: autotransporter assembly complex protein TamA [Gammaproteobacteria bacterium]